MNYKLLKKTCLQDISEFTRFGNVYDTPDGILIHKDMGSKILGVAHLDTVLSLTHFQKMDIGGREIVINAQLDDRLGVYTLLYTLPEMGIKFDLLLTEGEETGRSTAAWFESSKQYNWMFSFDRHGEDVVLYKYDSPDMRYVLQDSKFRVGIGSFSDIVFLDHLKIKGFNVGTGYEGEHSELCYADMEVWRRQVKRFADFYRKNHNIHYPHILTESKWWKKTYCDLCDEGIGKHLIKDYILCDACMVEVEPCTVCDELVYATELTDGVCFDCL